MPCLWVLKSTIYSCCHYMPHFWLEIGTRWCCEIGATWCCEISTRWCRNFARSAHDGAVRLMRDGAVRWCCCVAAVVQCTHGSGGIKQGGSPGRPGSAVWFGQPCKCKGPTIVGEVSPAAVAVAALQTADGGRRGNGSGGAKEERGSRNKMHPAQKIRAGLRPRAVPGGFV